jgi:hypothetical protein
MQNKKYPEWSDTNFVLRKIEHRIKYLKSVSDYIKIFGVHNAEDKLKELKIFTKLPNEPLMDGENGFYFKAETKGIIDLIINIGLSEYKKHGVKKENLFEIAHRGKYTELRDIIILLVVKYTKLSNYEVAKYFLRTRQIVFKIKKRYKVYSKNPYKYKSWLDSYKIIDNKIKQKIKK